MAGERSKPPFGGKPKDPQRGHDEVTAPVSVNELPPETLDLDELDDIFAEVDALDETTGIGGDGAPVPTPPPAAVRAKAPQTLPPPIAAASGTSGHWDSGLDEDPDLAVMQFSPPGPRPAAPTTLPPPEDMVLEPGAPVDSGPLFSDDEPSDAPALGEMEWAPPPPMIPARPFGAERASSATENLRASEPEPEPSTSPEPMAALPAPLVPAAPVVPASPSPSPSPVASSAASTGSSAGAATRARLARRTAPPDLQADPLGSPEPEPAPRPRAPNGPGVMPDLGRPAAEPNRAQTEAVRPSPRLSEPPQSPGRGARLSDPPPVAAPPEEPSIFNDHGLFRQEVNRLARSRDWQRLASVTAAALDDATWAKLPETRASLLEDLARVYRDRLKDISSAEDVFVRLAKEHPASPSAMEFLRERYGERGDWKAIFDLLAAAIEATWDPDQRLTWTRESVSLATEKLGMNDLAVEAWERLERLGDAADETQRALSETYRKTARWDKLAEFLQRRADKAQSAGRVLALREVAEAYLSGLRDQQKAAQVLEQILALRADDPIALLALARVLARRKEWEKLAALGDRPLAGQSKSAVLDFRRLIADALWSAGEHDRAAAAHERVLELDPDDGDALKAKEEYLQKTAQWAALVDFLAERADKAGDEDARLALLARAARLAEKELGAPGRAVALWEAHAALPAGRLEAYRALADLYAGQGDHAGVARALEGQVALVRERAARIELLRRLGEHCAHRMGDDRRAEECWKEIVALSPDDRGAADELLALQRRRGDFEGLDRTLSTQGWRASEDSAILDFWRRAADNIEDNITDASRAARAWWRVVDLAPKDGRALAALVRHRQHSGGAKDAIAALEDQVRATDDPAARIPLALRIGQLCEEVNDRAGALAAYERVLRWSPTDAAALDAVGRLAGPSGAGVVAGALDVAGAQSHGVARLALAEKAGALVADKDKLGRFFALRRILWLADRGDAALAALADAASAPEAWTDLAAVYLLLAADAPDAERRGVLIEKLAALYEKHLGDPARAFLVLEAAGQDPTVVGARLADLARLAEATKRHEDHLALLDVVARSGQPPAVRRQALKTRAQVCEEKLGDKERAFHEQTRLLAYDAHDAEALSEARRLAAARSLWRQLDALYAELWDRAQTDAERIELLKARQNVRALRLEDASGALDQLMTMYRLDPDQAELYDQILAAAEEQGAWEKVVPLLEARHRAAGDGANPDELLRIAELHEHKRKDPGRAYELYAEAFVLRPGAEALQAHVERLAAVTGRQDALAQTLRLAAACAGDPARRLALSRRVAELYAAQNRPAEALEAHRRILQIDPTQMASLEVVIGTLRGSGQPRELREALNRWIDLTAPGRPGAEAPGVTSQERVARLIDVARLSRDELADPEAALATYASILELDPHNETAIEGVRSLTEGAEDAALEARRLKLQLSRASGAARAELQLKLARLQEEEFDDVAAAIATLTTLVEEAGATGPGFEPLVRLLTREKRWTELLDLSEAHALALTGADERVAGLEKTIALLDAHPEPGSGGDARLERLCRRLLADREGDAESRRRLKSLYRSAGRHEDLAALLDAELGRLAEAPTDDETARDDVARELVRLYDRALGKLADAERVLKDLLARHPDERELGHALASLRLRQGDFAGYLKLRSEQAKRVGGPAGALILCHLAEASDENGQPQNKIADLYREARALDSKCEPSVEALKAIGRRSKNWRQGAALLAVEGEAKLAWAERASQLLKRGDAVADQNPAEAQGYYLRAVAVDPDCYPAWDALSRVETALDHDRDALAAESATLAAYERATTPEPGKLREHAERLSRLADARRAAADTAGADHLSRLAFELCPTFPAAALAVADQRLGDGDLTGAHKIFDRVLSDRGEALSDAEKLHATYQRGALAARLGRMDHAITDLREALRIDPLHSGALNALADALADKGRTAAAIQHYTQALLVAVDAQHRGLLYARIGRLWEDRLGVVDEAGECYERALPKVDDDRDLLRRGLRLYQRQGRTDDALGVIEKLLPGATEPRELADLWTARGNLLSERDPDKAIEAYDMSLSYDPGAAGALNGLAALLERRGEWAQLLDIFEARTESGPPEERAHALRHLARIAVQKLEDKVRSERYLKQAIELMATAEDYEQLLALYGDDPTRAVERREVVAGLLGTSGPWMSRLGELGRAAAASDRRLGWCLLSLLAGLTIPDAQLKGLVLELRKELEKGDHLDALGPTLHERVRPVALDAEVLAVLAEVDQAIPLGPTTPDAAGASGASKADTRTALGKTFAAIGERLGLGGAILWRAQTLGGAPVRIIDAETPQIAVRSELLQLLPIPEINLLFTSLLEMARPGVRLLLSLTHAEPPGQVRALLPAILAAGGVAETTDPLAAALAERILAGADEASRAAWARRLAAVAIVAADPAAAGERLAQAADEGARRVGLVAVPDLRTAARLLTRLDDSLPKMPTGGPLADMDGFIAGTPALKALIAFAAGDGFAAALAK